MKITRVCCQGCGADLEVDESVRFVTCNYCHAKLEIVHDASVTHTRLMEDLVRKTDRMAGNLRLIELQNDLERLDREWENQRQSYMVRRKNGDPYIPSVGGSVFSGVLVVALGVWWAITAASRSHGGGSATFVGVIMIFIGIYVAISGISKANAHSTAESAHEKTRNDLIAKIEAARRE